MGLRAAADIAGLPRQARVVATALKRALSHPRG
jgi:alkylated DNA nucleotide flippase Atl1